MPPDMPPLWLQGLTQEIVKIIDEKKSQLIT